MENAEVYEMILCLSEFRILYFLVDVHSIEIECERKEEPRVCVSCLSSNVVVNQRYYRHVRDLSISGKEVYLKILSRQYCCKACGRHYSESYESVGSGKQFTHRQLKWMYEMSEHQSFTASGAIENVNAKTMERNYLEQVVDIVNLPERYGQVRRLGMDDYAWQKGKGDYVCVLTDLDRGILIDILEDRKMETLIAHFEGLGTTFCAQIEWVACDMWDGFAGAAKHCFPNAEISTDRFHVVKQLNEVLDKERKEARKADSDNPLLKGIKWLLFKQPEQLSPEQTLKVQAALADNTELATLYEVRNIFNNIFDTNTKVEEAEIQLNYWIGFAEQHDNKHLNKFVKTLLNWKATILNFVKENITNAVTEGLNNLIRTTQRVAFGYTNFEHFKFRVLSISV